MTRPLLITAGATRNFIDSMRCITANASGKTGAFLASHFPNQCTLLGSPSAILHLAHMTNSSLDNHPSIHTQEFSSTADLHIKMQNWVLQNPSGIIVHSAAVGDYAPKESKNTKIPSKQHALSITLFPTIKILDEIKKWSAQCLVVSFKAAAPTTTQKELTYIANKQLQRSQSDLVFANVLTQTGHNVQLITPSKTHYFSSRNEAMEQLIAWIQSRRIEPLDPSTLSK